MKAKSILETLGRTPVVEISEKMNAGAAKVFAKVEAFNPGGSAKGFAGCVPDADLMRRVAQVGNGKIFGGYAFVMRAIFGFGDCFAGHPVPRPVFAGGSQGVSPLEAYASHGWMESD